MNDRLTQLIAFIPIILTFTIFSIIEVGKFVAIILFVFSMFWGLYWGLRKEKEFDW